MKYSKNDLWPAFCLETRCRILNKMGLSREEMQKFSHYEWNNIPNRIKRLSWGINFFHPPFWA